jgi:hypothetical protein
MKTPIKFLQFFLFAILLIQPAAVKAGYDPYLGRWLSRDPIGEEGGVNLYGYVSGQVVTRKDPLGLTDTILDPLWRNALEPLGKFLFDGPDSAVQSLKGGTADAVKTFVCTAATLSEESARAFQSVTGQPIESLGPLGGELGALPNQLRALSTIRRSDFIRTGRTIVSNQLIEGAGATGATIVEKCLKGGDGPLPYHFHIHKYNWSKPWTWFSNTPIIKP